MIVVLSRTFLFVHSCNRLWGHFYYLPLLLRLHTVWCLQVMSNVDVPSDSVSSKHTAKIQTRKHAALLILRIYVICIGQDAIR